MSENMDIIAGKLAGMTDIPTTISPPSLLMSTSSSSSSGYIPSPTSAPIPPPPLSTTTSTPSSSTSVISRPPKRHVRPRATTDEEKQERLEERKLANRTAAKQSRERQKQAMEEALRENERLKQENSQLLARLTNLEERMQEMESQQNKRRRLNEEGGSSTHQPARPMSTTEPQCPTLFLQQQRRPSYSKTHSTCPQTRLLVYALQILMHSFVLSLHFPTPLLNHFLLSATTLPCSHQHPSVIHKRNRLSSLQWTSPLLGYATPNRNDLSGAVRSAMVLRRERVKSSGVTSRRMVGKDWLRLVRRQGRRENGKYIRLIIKKGKRMNK